jgi:hypothetical protein
MKKKSGMNGETTFGADDTSALDADMIAGETIWPSAAPQRQMPQRQMPQPPASAR